MRGLEIVVLIGVTVLLLGAVSLRIHVAPPLPWLLGGVAIGFIPKVGDVELPPDVVLFLFLPALLYWESLTTSLREIRRSLRVIVLLSTMLVIATATATAAVGHALGLTWAMAFVLGAVVAPTDATAVSTVAGHLPRRFRTTLRAESLINDGTALVLFAVAVDAATGKHDFHLGSVALRLVASYAGGIAIGLATAGVVAFIRKHLDDTRLENVTSLLTPFLAYLPAELAHVSGVVAVVTCGLTLSQVGPRYVQARTRLQATAFWELTTYVLNGALFVLVGMQLHRVLDGLTSYSRSEALRDGLLVAVVVMGTRLAWSYTTPYVIRAVDHRPIQRERRVGARQRLPLAWAGFRGAVSLAAALAVPATTVSGSTLKGRDLVLLVTFAVIFVTLVVQGLTLPAIVRWAHLPEDNSEQEEQRLAERAATEAGLAALDERVAQLGSPEEVREIVLQSYQARLEQLDAEPDGHGWSGEALEERRLRAALLRDKRLAVVRLRDSQQIDDTVLRRLQSQLDAEEVRLTGAVEDD